MTDSRATHTRVQEPLTPGEAIALLDLVDNEHPDREWNREALFSARKKLDSIRAAHAIEIIDGMIADLEAM